MKPSLRRTVNEFWPVRSNEVKLSRRAARLATASDHYSDHQSRFERVEHESNDSYTLIRVHEDGSRRYERIAIPKGLVLTDDLVRELNSQEGRNRVNHIESISSEMIMGGLVLGISAGFALYHVNEERPEPQQVEPVCESYIDGGGYLQDTVGSIVTIQQIICESDQIAR